MPNRRQAIIWTNDGYFTDAYMRHSASMSLMGDENGWCISGVPEKQYAMGVCSRPYIMISWFVKFLWLLSSLDMVRCGGKVTENGVYRKGVIFNSTVWLCDLSNCVDMCFVPVTIRISRLVHHQTQIAKSFGLASNWHRSSTVCKRGLCWNMQYALAIISYIKLRV